MADDRRPRLTAPSGSGAPTHSAPGSGGPVVSGGRDVAVDAARGIALVCMVVAHTAPTTGPGGVLWLAEFVTAPLFATLIGMGSWLGWSRAVQGSGNPRGLFLSGVAVRAGALILIGLILEQLRHQVLIVLVPLGVLTLVAGLVTWLPAGVVAVTGVGATLVGSPLRVHLLPVEQRLAAEGYWPARVVDVLATGYAYRVTHFLAWACLGILLARRWELSRGFLGSRPPHDGRCLSTWQRVRGDGLLAGTAFVLAAGMGVAGSAGLVSLVPYVGTTPEVIFDALLCTAMVCAAAVAAALLPRAAVAPFAAAGSMMLTLYVLQILVLTLFVALAPAGVSDDSWAMLLGLTGALFGFAVLWPRLVDSPAFRRGPLEGLVRLFTPTASGEVGDGSQRQILGRG